MMPLIIEKLYAWVSEDDDGNQGVIAFISDGMSLPLVCADIVRVESFRRYVEQLSEHTKKKILLMEFSTKKVLEVIGDDEVIQ